VRRALCFAASREGGAAESDRPFRAAQSTKPNIARAKIGTAFSLKVFSVISVPSVLKALLEPRKDF
jgi:hypothetical protein